MKFFGIVAALLVSTVVAAPTPSGTEEISKRSADSIVASLHTLEADVTTLNNTLNSFNPTSITVLGGLLTVLNASDAVGTQIIAVTKQVSKTGVLGQDDSVAVGLEFINFVPQVESLLQNIVAVRPKVDSVGGTFSARKTVLSALQTDSSLTDKLFTAVTAAFQQSTLLDVIPGIQKEVDAAFATAINNYSKSIKGIELPAIPSNVRGDKVVNI